MSKRSVALLLTLVMVLSAATAAAAVKAIGPDPDEVFLAYHDPYFDLEIEYPTSWRVQEGAGGSLVAFASPPEPGGAQFSVNVSVAVEDLAGRPGTKLAEYEQAATGLLAKAGSDFALKDRRNVTVSGRPAVLIEYTYRQGISQLHALRSFTIANGKAFVTTFTAEEAGFARYKQVGLQIIDSLEIAPD